MLFSYLRYSKVRFIQPKAKVIFQKNIVLDLLIFHNIVVILIMNTNISKLDSNQL